jgi:hypothetical protein
VSLLTPTSAATFAVEQFFIVIPPLSYFYCPVNPAVPESLSEKEKPRQQPGREASS